MNRSEQAVDAAYRKEMKALNIYATKLGCHDFYIALLGTEIHPSQMKSCIDAAARGKGNRASGRIESDDDKAAAAARFKVIAECAYAQSNPSMDPQSADAPPVFWGGSEAEQLLAAKGFASARRLWAGPPSSKSK